MASTAMMRVQKVPVGDGEVEGGSGRMDDNRFYLRKMRKRVRGQQAAASAAGASGRTSAKSSAQLAFGEELLLLLQQQQQQRGQFLEGEGVHFAY